MRQADKIEEVLDRLYLELDLLCELLKPYEATFVAAGGKPLAEQGASDRIKIAKALVAMLNCPAPQ